MTSVEDQRPFERVLSRENDSFEAQNVEVGGWRSSQVGDVCPDGRVVSRGDGHDEGWKCTQSWDVVVVATAGDGCKRSHLSE